MTAGIQTER